MGRLSLAGSVASSVSGGASGLPTSVCLYLRIAKRDNGTVELRWKDPDDTIIDGQVLCSWKNSIVVRKQGGYPEHESDGMVVVDNVVRNAYNLTAFVDTLPDMENEYFYRVFPISVNGVVNYDNKNKFGNKVYEFILNPNDSNPATCIKYAGENENYTPAKMNYTTGQFDYGSWADAFFMALFRPCMLYNNRATDSEGASLNGQVMEYLDPDNYGLTIDGDASHVADTSCNANAMVEVGQIWINEEIDADGKFHIRIASEQINENYDCFTHINKDGTYRDVIYRSIYDGCNISNTIRSISGQAICKTVAGDTQISYAKANGDGWNVDEYNFRRLINYLLLLIGRSTDTQTTFGTGRYSGGSANNNNQLNTGTLDTKGMFYGDNNNGAVKVFHIENWWGNIWKITNGVIQNGGKLLYKMCEGTLDGSTVEEYNTNGSGYIESGVVASGTISEQYIKRMSLVPKLGLVPNNDSGGSSSTYFCDGWWSNSTVVGFARFGSIPADGLAVGAFAFHAYVVVSHSNWNFGVSLSYKKAS